MTRSIKKEVDQNSSAFENDIKEMQRYLDINETPLRASEQYATDKSLIFKENEARGYWLRWYKFYFLKYAPINYISKL